MARSAAALLAVMILPGSIVAQDVPTLAQGPQQETPSGTHTVMDFDTLWDLAQLYLNDAWQWPRIWDANRAQVENPDLIFPGWVLVIPGLEGQAAEGAPEGTPAGDVGVIEIEVQPSPVPVPRRANPASTRTIFYQDTAAFRASVMALSEIEYPAVSRDGVYSAPWLIPLFSDAESDGVLEGLAGDQARVRALRTFDRVRLSFEGDVPRVGDLLQLYRVSHDIPDVGRVVQPTGVVTVSELGGDGAVGIVTKEYGRITAGDLVRPVPGYTLTDGQRAEPVSGGSESVILGFEGRDALHEPGSIAFLDIGADDGVAIGDVFELFDRTAGTGVTSGALRVVGVTSHGAAARIVQMDADVFNSGVVVQLTRKMR
jgi:hypothetical protein